MITIPVHIKECNDLPFISGKQKKYSYAFRSVYSSSHKIKDKEFELHIRKKFTLTDIEYRSLVSDVENKIAQTNTNKENQEVRMMEITQDIEQLNENKKSNSITRKKFKKHKKYRELENSLPQNITFGGKQTLRELTRLHNKITAINRELNVEKRNKMLSENQSWIDKKTIEWKQNRILHVYLLGEANQKGNRYFDFNFVDKSIIYKPYKGKKVEIKYSCNGNHQKQLLELQQFIDSKAMSVTITMSEKQICISFDDEIISGYCIDKQERRKDVEKIKEKNLSPEKQTEEIKKLYKANHDSLEEKKLTGKISNRFLSYDSNPYYLGWCIADKGEMGIKRIIEKGFIDLTGLNENLKLSSDHPLVKKQNNKRVNEIQNAWKKLFDIAHHYKCAYFVHEDISNIGKNEKFDSHLANRKVKNQWHRGITDWQIKKRCTKYGMQIIPIISVYTSFIGNLMYQYFDATNAAIEICRRGMFKFNKGMFYPAIAGTIPDTVRGLFECQGIQMRPEDVRVLKDCESWKSLYKTASYNGLRWRWDMDKVEKPHSVFSMGSAKSKVNFVRFTD